MDVHDAMTQISEIRQRMVRGQVFRGYRAATVAMMGVVAVLAALAQRRWIEDPSHHLTAYVGLWVAAAVVCAGWALVQLGVRYLRCRSSLQQNLTITAIGQLAPAMIGGAMVTAVILRYAVDSAWMLPGLWGVLFSMGVFASRNVLSPAVFWPGAYYVLGGLVCLAIGSGEHMLSPWMMGLMFGPGQLLSAAALYWGVEPDHG